MVTTSRPTRPSLRTTSPRRQTVTGTEKLMRYSSVAGERALSAYAWEDGTGPL